MSAHKNGLATAMICVQINGRTEALTRHQADNLRRAIEDALHLNSTQSDLIKLTVCKAFDISIVEMDSDTRPERIVLPRQFAMAMHGELLNMNLGQIGKAFPHLNGQARDHGTALHAIRKIKDVCATNRKMKAKLDALRGKLAKII